MRIVQLITRPQRRGAEIFAVQLSEQLRQLGHQVVLISLFEGPGGLDFSGEWISLDWKGKGNLALPAYWKLARLLDQLEPDIVQANASDTLRFGAFANLLGRRRFTLVYRNANQISHFLDSRFKKSWIRFLLSQVDGIASVSEGSKADFLQTFPTSKPLAVLPIGVDLEELQAKSNMESSWKLSDPYILSMGGLVPEKNQAALLRVVARLENSQVSNLSLVLMGEGPEQVKLEQLATSLGISERVHFLPNQQNPFPILAHAKALALSSKAEGLPGVILEAMALKVPVIAYGVGGIPEVLDSKTGWCIAPNDEKEFLKYLKALLNTPRENLLALTQSANQCVFSEYSLFKISKGFEQFYFKLKRKK